MDEQISALLRKVKHELTVLDNLTVTDKPAQIGKRDDIFWVTDHTKLIAEIDSLLK